MSTIQGKNINLRLARVDDAEFILSLRLQQHKSQYLSSVENDLAKQQAWLQNYQQKEQQGAEYYFVIESKQHENLGLVRVYALQPNSFCWGSWLIKDGAPVTTAIESMIMVYNFGFEALKKDIARIDVRNRNKKVIAIHKGFGAKVISKSEQDTFFELDSITYSKSKQRFLKYI